MTQNKIKKIFADNFGDSEIFDKWVKLPQISIIYLNQDANIYVNDNCLFYFNSTDETLNLAQNYKYREYTNDNLADKSFESFGVTSIFQLDSIAGFITSSTFGPGGTYINRRF